MAEGLTKKQLKELRKLEKLQSRNIEQKNDMVKWIAISVASLLFLVLFIGVIIAAKNKDKPAEQSQVAQIAEGKNVRKVSTSPNEATNSADQAKRQLTLVEYADIQCPACRQSHPVVTQLLTAFPDRLRLMFKHFPLTVAHPNAHAAAIAAEAAGRQNKFFELVDTMYEKQDEWAGLADPQAKFEEYAKGVGLDVEQFKKDQKDPAIEKQVNDDREEGINNGVNGTPTFFLDGERIENPGSLDEFKKIIDEKLRLKGESSQPTQQPSTSAPDTLPLQQ